MIWGLVLGAVLGVLLCATLGPWVLDAYARAHGGVWRHGGGFTCPGCTEHRRIARPGPTGSSLCLHCSPAPQPGGNR